MAEQQWEAPTREREGRDKDRRVRIVAHLPLDRLLSERVDNDMRTPTHVINVAVDRYLRALAAAMPAFGETEWLVIFDALNGSIYWDTADAVDSLGSDIADAMIDGGLAEKWGAKPELGQRIAAMSYIEKAAIIDTAERFWSRYGGQAVEVGDALKALGVFTNGRDMD